MNSISPERWQQVKEVFQAALDQPPDRRRAFLTEVCAGDEELRSEVEALVANDEQPDSLLDASVYALAAKIMAEDPTKSWTGRTIGAYQIMRELGRGGMGQVYLALDSRLNRKVALKLLLVHFMRDADRTHRFVREAKATSALNHPNIITVYEIGELEGIPFIATEFVDGETLRERLMRGRLDIVEVLDIGAQMASALAAAHTAGIVHRDIKPENVMLRQDGYVKVLDFGLAKLVERRTQPLGMTITSSGSLPGGIIGPSVTVPGLILGTVNYMSPEQARGLEVDTRADIFSFGAVLYEMVTGRLPFAGEVPADVVAAVLTHTPPPLAEHVVGVPAKLESIIQRALQKNREERYQSVKELELEFRHLRQELNYAGSSGAKLRSQYSSKPQRISPPASKRTLLAQINQWLKWKPNVAIWVGVLLIAALALVSYQLLRMNRYRLPVAAVQMIPVTNSGDVIAATIAPNGQQIAYVRRDQYERFSLWLKQVGPGTDLPIGPPEEGYEYVRLAFSPDGDYLFFTGRARNTKGPIAIYQRPVLAGPVKKIIEDVEKAIALSPNGKQLAFFRRDLQRGEISLMIANADGTEERVLAQRRSPDGFIRNALDWSPDGRAVTCAAMTASEKDSNAISLISVRLSDGQEESIRSPQFQNINGISWLPDGTSLMLAATGSQMGSQVWRLSYPSGEAQQLTNNLTDIVDLRSDAAANSLVTVQRADNANILVVAPEKGERAQRVVSGTGENIEMSWAPDGGLVYAASIEGRRHLWRTRIGGETARLTFGDNDNGLPAVSPDGKYIVFMSTRSGKLNLWRMREDGSEQVQLTSGQSDHAPAISPDGQWVIYASRIQGGWGIFRVKMSGGPSELLLMAGGYAACPVISPDRMMIAYIQVVKPIGQPQIVVIPFNGGAPIKTFSFPSVSDGASSHGSGGGRLLRWAPDGQGLTYINTQDGNSEIWHQPLAGGDAKPLTNLGLGQLSYFAWSPDGSQLAVSRSELVSQAVMVYNFKPLAQ